jgi:phosphatidylserine/phosphatidylglycerophosphate/cardiolipin synthase-like enzyme
MPAWAWWGLISGGLCFLSWMYGRLSRPRAPAGNGPWETSWAVYFSPKSGADHPIRNGIRSAQHTILVQAYLLRSTRLAGALVRAHQRGVQVHIILDANAQPHYPLVQAVELLLGAGIAVSLDARHESAHDKVMILDGAIVITGSYNRTFAAEHNNGENLLVIRDPRLCKGVYRELAASCRPQHRISRCGTVADVHPSHMGLPHTQASSAVEHGNCLGLLISR